MTEKPILFTPDNAQKVHDGLKTQTRRVPKVNLFYGDFKWDDLFRDDGGILHVPQSGGEYGDATVRRLYPKYQVGDRLWVRETWRHDDYCDMPMCSSPACVIYKAEHLEIAKEVGKAVKWKSSMFMPRWASRTILEVTGVKAERLQDISEEDARAEGIHELPDKKGVFDGGGPAMGLTAKIAFMRLWESINGKKAGATWEDNPWVWAYEFKRVIF